MSKLSLRSKGIFIVALPVAVSVIFTGILFSTLQQTEEENRRHMFGLDLSALAANMQLNYYNAILEARTWHSTRSETAGTKLDALLATIKTQEVRLSDLVKDHPDLESKVRTTLDDGAKARAFLLKIRNGASKHFGGDLEPRIFHKTGLSFMEDISQDFGDLNLLAHDILNSSERDASRAATVPVMIALTVVNVVLAFILAIFYSKSVTGRIAVVRKNAFRLASGQPLIEPLSAGDEISELDASFHKMAFALHEASTKEQALLENASDVLCSIDAQELRFVRVSAASLGAWGYPPEELLGSRIVQILNPDTVTGTIASLESLVHGPSSAGTFDVQLKRKDGRLIDSQFSCYWSRDKATLFCVARDVTREREFERIKQRLMDTIAHDLRSPIASIKVVLDSLAMGTYGDISEKAQKKVASAENSADRLLRLVNDLLDYEKFESGQFSLVLLDHSIQDIMYASTVAVEGLVEDKNLTIAVEGDDLSVRVDSDRLTQAIVNLLSNAIKFSPEKTKITMTCGKNGSYAMVDIADRGPGIPDNMKDQIFERFKQVEGQPTVESSRDMARVPSVGEDVGEGGDGGDGKESSGGDSKGTARPKTKAELMELSKHKKGTGLGLPIARQIIEAHGGSIGVRDNEGGGTIFWFTVPLSASEPAEATS